ncbi:MAG: hypothetical protein U0414_20180 [Polyangiaceae bacterium]
MKRASIVLTCVWIGACAGTSDVDGTGGSTSTATQTVAATTASASTNSASSGTPTCGDPGPNVYDNTTGASEANCTFSLVPLPNEDGTFVVTVFGPFSTPFSFDTVVFAAGNSPPVTEITDPWTVSVQRVPNGGDPKLVDPNTDAKPRPLTLVESLSSDQIRRYSIKLDAPLTVGACESVVVALRNSRVDPPDPNGAATAIHMCGAKSTHSSTNLWWNLDGTMVPIASFNPDFDRDWWVSMTPLP